MSCETVIGSIVALLDGELAGTERHAVEQHLAGCAACQRELDELRRTRELLDRGLDALGASVGRTSFEKLWLRAQDDEADGLRRPPSRSRPSGASRVARRRIVWAGAGGFALAASLALMLVGLPGEQGDQPVPPAGKERTTVAAPAVGSAPNPAEPVVVAAKPAPPPARVAPEEAREDEGDVGDDIEPVELPADDAAVVANEIDPPRELLERPELFLNYPIVRKLDELRHLESVLADSPDPTAEGGAG